VAYQIPGNRQTADLPQLTIGLRRITKAMQASFSRRFDDGGALDLTDAPTMTKENCECEIRYLLGKESTHNFMNEDGETALHLAAVENENLTREVLGFGFDINVRNLDGRTPLMCAVDAQNIETVALLLKNHADVNAVEEQGTCLHLAALKDMSGTITQLLLRHNADTELVDGMSLTPLSVAAFNGNDTITRHLL
jgi:ankyrin repeat protein